MSEESYARERIDDLLARQKLPPSYRIIPQRYREKPLGIAPGDSRFCTKADGYNVLYASPDFATTFIETVVRDRFTHRQQRNVLLKEVTERAWGLLATKPRFKLKLLDLRQDGCIRLGAPTDAVNARNHAAGRALGRTLYGEHKDIDGLLFSSRLTGADVYAIFDRAISKLECKKAGALPYHTDLPGVLAEHRINILVRY